MSEAPTAGVSDPRPGPWWAPLALSVAFLTIVPVPSTTATLRGQRVAIGLFPVVGAFLGGIAGLGALGLDRLLPPAVVAAIALAAVVLLTGGLHLDGLIDTADGVFGGQTTERRLEIMRDSRIGSFGALAAILALLTQHACLASLNGSDRLVALVVSLALSRWAMVIALATFPSARPTGLGSTFHSAARGWPTVVAAAFALVVGASAGVLGLAGFLTATAGALLAGLWLTRRLGGLTGDTYGAIAVVVETVLLVLAVGWWAH